MDQARAALPAALLCLAAMPLLTGCGGRSFSQNWAYAWGPAFDGRPPPPGADQPYPNLGTVPERPARPTPGQRQALTSRLEAERAAASRPIMGGGPARIPAVAGPIQDRTIPTTPPTPAAIQAAPEIQVDPPAVPAPAPAPPVADRAPVTPAPAPSRQPATAPVSLTPAAPTTPARPPVGISPAPPPAPAPALLTPGEGPPAAPTSDLLAPSPRNR